MALSEIMKPFSQVINWLRNTTFYLGEYPFTIWELIMWQIFAMVAIYWVKKLVFED